MQSATEDTEQSATDSDASSAHGEEEDAAERGDVDIRGGDSAGEEELEMEEGDAASHDEDEVMPDPPSSSSDAEAVGHPPWSGGAQGTFKWPARAGRRLRQREFFDLLDARDPVLVVGVFGKGSGDFLGNVCDSTASAKVSQEGLLDRVLQRDVFWVGAQDEEEQDLGKNPYIQGYVDTKYDRIYLNLRGLCDASALVGECEAAREEVEKEGFQVFMASRAYSGCRLLLFLLHTCHVLVMYQPNYTIDVQYVQIFKALDSVRTKLQPILSDALRERCKVTLGRDWIGSGRPATPKMLFYFATCPVGLRGTRGTSDLVKRDGKVSRHPPVRKLEFSLEDQLRQIFTRTKVVESHHSGSRSTSSSGGSLFSLPREGFVFVENGPNGFAGADDEQQHLDSIYDALDNPSVPKEMTSPFLPYFEEQKLEESRPVRCFARFLQSRMDIIQHRRVDGDGKSGGLQLPTLDQWLSFCETVFPIFVEDNAKSVELERAFGPLKAFCDIDIRFSEYKCGKALPMAIAAYKEGLQAQYVEEFHNAKLLQAMSLFSLHARGPAAARHAEMLAEECVDYWRGGRQLCEERSLTGRRCANRKHRVPGMPPDASASAAAREDAIGAKK